MAIAIMDIAIVNVDMAGGYVHHSDRYYGHGDCEGVHSDRYCGHNGQLCSTQRSVSIAMVTIVRGYVHHCDRYGGHGDCYDGHNARLCQPWQSQWWT